MNLLDLVIAPAYAQAAPAASPGFGGMNIIFLVVMMAAMYFLMIRPQMKRAKETKAMIEACTGRIPIEKLAGHYHDTYGQALANIYASLEIGVRTFDASVAGLGGCPYAAGASGNVATEDVVYMLHGLGMDTGVDLDQLVDIGQWISAILQREPASKVNRALAAKRKKS